MQNRWPCSKCLGKGAYARYGIMEPCDACGRKGWVTGSSGGGSSAETPESFAQLFGCLFSMVAFVLIIGSCRLLTTSSPAGPSSAGSGDGGPAAASDDSALTRPGPSATPPRRVHTEDEWNAMVERVLKEQAEWEADAEGEGLETTGDD